MSEITTRTEVKHFVVISADGRRRTIEVTYLVTASPPGVERWLKVHGSAQVCRCAEVPHECAAPT